jgi:amidase
MARTVEDVALMLAAMAGPDPRSPISIDERGDRFVEKLDRDFHGVQVAFSPNFGGLFPVERTVSNVVATAEPVLRGLGCVLSDTLPDFSGADDAFRVNRAWAFEQLCGRYLAEHRERMKETLVWNIECGRKLTGADLSRAEQARTGLYHRLRQFMMRHEFVVLPVTQVAPFPIEWEYPQDIDGTPMETYLDWMKSCYYITATGHPAISLPCGFTPDGLPVGLQIVGRHRDDFGVLQLAYAFQEATGFNSRRPDLSVGVCE